MAHHTSGTYAGCTQLYLNYRYTLYLSSTYSGIYTCTRQDSNSNSISVNIGLYSEGFRSKSNLVGSYNMYNNNN